MTPQEAFTKSVVHTLQQGKRSTRLMPYSAKKVCAYRGDNGLKCAIGALIPDNEYIPEMEGNLIIDNFRRGFIPPSLAGFEDIWLLSSIQSVHDNEDVSEWENGFRRVAHVYNLIFPDFKLRSA